jgi:hypothetical protein
MIAWRAAPREVIASVGGQTVAALVPPLQVAVTVGLLSELEHAIGHADAFPSAAIWFVGLGGLLLVSAGSRTLSSC